MVAAQRNIHIGFISEYMLGLGADWSL